MINNDGHDILYSAGRNQFYVFLDLFNWLVSTDNPKIAYNEFDCL